MRLTGIIAIFLITGISVSNSYTRYFSFRALNERTGERIDLDSIHITSEMHGVDTVITSSSILFELPDTGIEIDKAEVKPKFSSVGKTLQVDYHRQFTTKIIDLSGRIVGSFSEPEINLSLLSTGIYFLEIESDGLKYNTSLTISENSLLLSENSNSDSIPVNTVKDKYPENEFRFVAYKDWFDTDTLFNQDITDYGKMVFEMGIINDLLFKVGSIQYNLTLDSVKFIHQSYPNKANVWIRTANISKYMFKPFLSKSQPENAYESYSSICRGTFFCWLIYTAGSHDEIIRLNFNPEEGKVDYFYHSESRGTSSSRESYSFKCQNLMYEEHADHILIWSEGENFTNGFEDYGTEGRTGHYTLFGSGCIATKPTGSIYIKIEKIE
jgi:hypothetical protein